MQLETEGLVIRAIAGAVVVVRYSMYGHGRRKDVARPWLNWLASATVCRMILKVTSKLVTVQSRLPTITSAHEL